MQLPTTEELASAAKALGMTLTPEQSAEYRSLMQGTVEGYQLLARLPDNLPVVHYPRTPGYFPSAEENALNAWYVKTVIKGAADGPLKGKRVAIKDNVCVAGVPMMNGAATLEGYVPDCDATVVTRILDAGGQVDGKAHCEFFCMSGGSHTNAKGVVWNPRKRGHLAGGSSSGSAALVAAGEVDLAIGGDQGGSIRIPSAYCGTVGMKPTFGLVPYTGAMPIEATLDHLGPISRTVESNAAFLEVLAGPDGLDPRQSGQPREPYAQALGKSIRGLRIGILSEGFGHANSDPQVDEVVREAAAVFQRLGADVREVSIPDHLIAPAAWSVIAHEGGTQQMLLGNGFGFNWKGLYIPSLMQAHDSWRTRADAFSESLKATALFGQYALTKYRGLYYARAQNLSRRICAAYDRALADHDVLLMPTVPIRAPKAPAAGASITEICMRAFEMIGNTAPFNLTGHPAISIPCGVRDDLPIGMMLVGRHEAESTLYQLGHAFEQGADWQRL
ncbi:MAG: amidase [Panacagrimonas sp.]